MSEIITQTITYPLFNEFVRIITKIGPLLLGVFYASYIACLGLILNDWLLNLKRRKGRDSMKVRSWNHDGPYEIPKEDMTFETTLTSFKCPICKGKAYLNEIDLYICQSCGLGWSVE